MKTKRFVPVLAFLAALLALIHPTEAAARSRYVSAEPGRIVLRFSPVTPIDIGVPVVIDGRNAGALTKGHTFVRYLLPGRHVISVSRNGRGRERTSTFLNVNPGETYAFTVKYRVNEVILVPAGR